MTVTNISLRSTWEAGTWWRVGNGRIQQVLEREVVWEHRHQLLKTKDLGMVKRIREDPETDLSPWENGVRVRES